MNVDALRALEKAVEAGGVTTIDVTAALGHKNGVMARMAFHGSLDAAKALHEAVLQKDLCASIDAIFRPSAIAEWRAIIHQQGVYFPQIPLRITVECGHDVTWNDPARAWLLAIVRALISRAEQGEG